MPAQALLDARALGDELLAVVEQQPRSRAPAPASCADGQLAARAAPRGRPRARRSRPTCRAAAERRAPRHQLGRHAHDPLAAGEQKAARASPRRAGSPRARTAARSPSARAHASSARGRAGARCTVSSPTQLAASRLDGDGGVASACAGRPRLRSLPVPFPEVATDSGPPADRPQWGRLATLLSGHAGAPRTAAGDRSRAGQAVGRHRA